MKGLVSLIVVGALALAGVGCSSDDGPSSSATTDTTTTSTTATTAPATTSIGSTLAAGDHYVALGSSIASGFGIPVQSTSCGRSDRNYPQLLAKAYDLDLTDVTCGAATIPNVIDSAQGANPPQIEAVTKDARLITLTVGGNDITYNGTAVGCGDPATVCKAPATLDADLTTTETALTTLIAELRKLAPQATLVLVTYPREIPEGNCPALSLTDAEAGILRDMGARLEQLFVAVAGTTDVVLVDPYVVAGDHTGCAAEDQRWVAGHVAPDGFPYHPTALGHEVMEQMVADALGR